MTIKDYLSRGYKLRSEIQLKREQLENVSESISNLSVHLDGVKIIKTPTTSSVENGVIQIVELKEYIEKSIAQLAVVGEEAVQVISKLHDFKTESMLIKYYVGFKSWNDIASEMDLSYKTVINSHYRAIHKLEQIMKDSPLLEGDDVA